MKKIWIVLPAILALAFFSGCQAKESTGVSAYTDHISKAQEIAIVSSATSEAMEIITDEEDIADTEDADENVILGQDVEAGTKLAKGDIITLTIPNIYTTYPDFAAEGYTVVDVRSFCEDNDLTLEIKYQDSDTEADGTIIYQNMSPGTMVNEGATLKITVIKKEAEPATE